MMERNPISRHLFEIGLWPIGATSPVLSIGLENPQNQYICKNK